MSEKPALTVGQMMADLAALGVFERAERRIKERHERAARVFGLRPAPAGRLK